MDGDYTQSVQPYPFTPRGHMFSYFDQNTQELTIFGGQGYGFFSNMWTWSADYGWEYQSGSNFSDVEYLVQVGPYATPGARADGAMWKDSDNLIWIFGGNNGNGLNFLEL